MGYAVSWLRIRWLGFEEKRSMELRQLGFKMLSCGDMPWVIEKDIEEPDPTPELLDHLGL